VAAGPQGLESDAGETGAPPDVETATWTLACSFSASGGGHGRGHDACGAVRRARMAGFTKHMTVPDPEHSPASRPHRRELQPKPYEISALKISTAGLGAGLRRRGFMTGSPFKHAGPFYPAGQLTGAAGDVRAAALDPRGTTLAACIHGALGDEATLFGCGAIGKEKPCFSTGRL